MGPPAVALEEIGRDRCGWSTGRRPARVRIDPIHLTAGSARRWFWILVVTHVAVWTLIPTLTFSNAPLDVQEITTWGRNLQWGYAKHPPLPSWVLDLARRTGGSSADWPAYLIGQLAVAVSLWATWRLAAALLDPPMALLAVFLSESSLFNTWLATHFNHNVAPLPFFALAIWSLHRALTVGGARWWLTLGASIGLGALSKYTTGLLVAAMALFILWDRRARLSLKTAGPWLALLTATAIFAPHLIWVAEHDFGPLKYLSNRLTNRLGALGHIAHPLVFIGGQLLYAGLPMLATVPMLAKPWRLRELDRCERFNRSFLRAMVFGPTVILCAASAVSGMNLSDGTWGLPFWSGVGVLALYAWRLDSSAPAYRAAVRLALLAGAANMAIGLGVPLLTPYLTGRGDRLNFPGRQLSAEVSRLWTERTGRSLPWAGGEHWLADNVAYYSSTRTRVCSGGRLNIAEVDPLFCPPATVEAFKAAGGMLTWYADREGASLPHILAIHFPEAQTLSPLTLAWQTRARLAPLRIGVAIVPPSGGILP